MITIFLVNNMNHNFFTPEILTHFSSIIPDLCNSNIPIAFEKLIQNFNKPFIFNIAPPQLWYNWANSIGKKYSCITYSAGTTYFFQNQNPLKPPIAQIYSNSDFNTNTQKSPKYSITIPAQGIRSTLIIDDVQNPYALLGTFSYPQQGTPSSTSLFRWDFLSNKLTRILTIDGSNSIRTIIRYKKDKIDTIFFSTQEDLFIPNPSRIYTVPTSATSLPDISKNIKKFNLLDFQNKPIIGTVWDFSLDNDTIYISCPQGSLDQTKISGFTIKGRIFYQKISQFLCNKSNINLISLIGNDKYPAGFGIDNLSTFQIQTSPCSNEIFIYSLSDFLYQSLAILQNPERIPSPPQNIPEIIQFLRQVASNIDLDGTRIFKINKNQLFKQNIPDITTILGNAPKNTINNSTTNNGNNNFLNVYTWQSTSYKKNIYFGTLDVRFPLWQFISQFIGQQLQNPQITQFLLKLPQPLIILLTEFFLNQNFNFNTFIQTYFNKLLHFDILHYNTTNQQFKTITVNGFASSKPFLPDDGVRNLDIINNCNGIFLLTGSTAYQPDNSAKLYTFQIGQ